MLKQLYIKGPFTVGVLRKSANARICRELKAKLDENSDSPLDDFPVIVIASVFKEFLRSLPDCLLQSKLYYKWIEAISIENNFECREKIVKLLHSLPSTNLLLLRHLFCVLWHIAQRSSENKMCPLNLGVCIGPSLLCHKEQPSILRCEEMSKKVPKLIAYLIEHCPVLLGESTLKLFDDLVDKRDSGAEESDSLKSLQEGGVAFSCNIDHRRDYSSTDSIERVLMDENPGNKDHINDSSDFCNKMSLSNLSRDSGLTLSDTQLYSPEEEDEESDLSDTSGVLPGSRLLPYLTKSVPHLDSTGLENVINITFSYGRSVGVSIDGSCNDVVRKRRHQDPSGKRHVLGGVVGYRNNSTFCDMKNNHLPLKYSESYGCDINQSIDNLAKRRNEFQSKNATRYRHRRPPLTAILNNSKEPETFPSVAFRRSTSEESLRVHYESDHIVQEPISLPYNFERNEDETDYTSLNKSRSKIHSLHSSHNEIVNVSWKGEACNQDAINDMMLHQPLAKLCSGSKINVNQRVGSISSSSSDTTSQYSSASKHSNNSSVARSNLNIFPPSYQETMSRKEILARTQNNSVSRRISSTSTVSSSEIYEQSVRVYNEDLQKGSNVFLRAIPVRVKSNDSDCSDTEPINQVRKQALCRISSERQPLLEAVSTKRPLRFCNSAQTKSPEKSCNAVAIEERCAKDLTDDWRKEVNWSVAQLRTLFNDKSKDARETAVNGKTSVSIIKRTSEVNDVKNHVCNQPNKENCVTVIHVSQSGANGTIPIAIHKRSESTESSEEESYV
ncbi:Rho GTPase-activating protein 20-like protein [Dinothrombium tinctorium]|uniref:Rho GTPase-activating protein 20-like protein n=1 Tax=Dinothrombium tinctorium TaxID=1965070 RepID=A0A443RIP2_9ACAR|nr:Rho GTPase-activating protein 20-like protein [Dinothrombium tinctorium]